LTDDGVTESSQLSVNIDPLVVLIPVMAYDQSPAVSDGGVLAGDELRPVPKSLVPRRQGTVVDGAYVY
jgi:hypothetical protein